MAEAYEPNNLCSTSDDASDGPIHGSRDVGHRRRHVGGVDGDVLRRKLGELYDALGDIQHGPDEVVDGVESRLENVGMLENVGELLQQRDGLGERADRVELRGEPELTVAHRERRECEDDFGVPGVARERVEESQSYCVRVAAARTLARNL